MDLSGIRPKPISFVVIGITAMAAGCGLAGDFLEIQRPSRPTVEFTATAVSPIQGPTPTPESVDQFLSRCLTADEVASVDADLSISFENYGYSSGITFPTPAPGDSIPRGPFGTLVCMEEAGYVDLDIAQLRTYQAILAMRQLEFDEPLPWTDKTLYEWFVSAVDGIRVRDDIEFSSCCSPQNVINITTLEQPAFQTDRWIDPEREASRPFMHPWIDPRIGQGMQSLVATLVGAARYNEVGTYTCPDFKDMTVDELGVWGVEYYFFLWLAGHSDLEYLTAGASQPNYYQGRARVAADAIRSQRFCAEPPGTPVGYLAGILPP